ncbi:hypothetical protein RJT34_03470 [Clitoria ternatea]|uniref:Uncharacterized protein n=1 Tax=Clitoria ternatea TaxID=43366 RepID=A0AAN9KM83_CLITE
MYYCTNIEGYFREIYRNNTQYYSINTLNSLNIVEEARMDTNRTVPSETEKGWMPLTLQSWIVFAMSDHAGEVF